MENKIQKQMIGMSVSGAWAFNLVRKDESGNDVEKNAAYRIQIKMSEVTNLKNTRLYHQKENGDMEELTFTSGVSEDNMQKLEFVSSDGLGDFIFAGIEKDLTVNDSVNESVDETIESSNSDNAKESDSEGGNLTVNNNSDSSKQDSGNTESDSAAENSNSSKTSSQDENTVDTSSNLKTEENSNNNADDITDKLSSEENVEGNTEENKSEDTVIPIDISEFHVAFVSGADKIDDKYIWNPSDSAAGHSFIYRVNYTMSGTFSTDIGAFKIEVPLHILKDKDGNWADTFTCPYWLRSSITENDNPDFVYEIDEENNKAIIYNYKPYPTGEAGYVEFAYETTKDTTNYTDMTSSTKVPAKIYATSDTTTVTKESEAEEVYIDTHATVAYTQKKKPTLYKSWNNLWGQEPENANNYYYLVWSIRTYINKNTSAYDFYLNDICTDMESQVVGYKFSGQSEFSDINHIDNLITYGDRYDYVLTRYSKDKADAAVKNEERFYIHNDIEAIVRPSDHIDSDTNATSSYDWFYESPLYNGGNGTFWAEKFGIYGAYNRVESSEDISNFMLGEFESGEIDVLPNLKYRAIADGAPNGYTLADGASGGLEDALR